MGNKERLVVMEMNAWEVEMKKQEEESLRRQEWVECLRAELRACKCNHPEREQMCGKCRNIVSDIYHVQGDWKALEQHAVDLNQ